MRRVKSWALWALILGSYVLGGLLIGWEVDALRRDLIPLLFGALVVLVLDQTVEEAENEREDT